MPSFHDQLLRACLAELSNNVKGYVTDPVGLAKLEMTRFLLAYAALQGEAIGEFLSIEDEVHTLDNAENAEKGLLAAQTPQRTHSTPVTVDSLTAYVQRKLKDPHVTVTRIDASLGGFSKHTYLLALDGAALLENQLVIRQDQLDGPVESRAVHEYAVLRLMHSTGVPVPEILWADEASPFGGSCLAMRRQPGKTVYDASGVTIGIDGAAASMELARVLARVHATPIGSLQVIDESGHTSVQSHVLKLLEDFEDQWGRRRLSSSPTLAAAFRWLSNNIPRGLAPSLVHGDASLRNVLMDDGKISALLDWELWHWGDPCEDLAYCRSDVERFVPWESFIAEYEKGGGRRPTSSAMDYYQLYGAVRNAVFAAACLHAFINMSHPDPKLAYGALAMGRRLIGQIATQLKTLGIA